MRRIKDKKHLMRICEDGCMLCGNYAVPHHLLRSGSHGMGLKAGDDEAVPLCHFCHSDLHQSGDEVGFFEKRGWGYDRVIDHAAAIYERTLALRK